MKELILVRHAKSEWPQGFSDIERPLSERGQRDCLSAAEFFKNLPNINEFEVHVSAAVRTQETWELIERSLGIDVDKFVTDTIYEASVGDLINYLEGLGKDHLIFVGHNPGLALLGRYLTGQRIMKFPTLSIWHIETEGKWQADSAKTLYRNAPRADNLNEDND